MGSRNEVGESAVGAERDHLWHSGEPWDDWGKGRRGVRWRKPVDLKWTLPGLVVAGPS